MDAWLQKPTKDQLSRLMKSLQVAGLELSLPLRWTKRGENGKSWFSNFCVWFMFLDVSDRIKNQLRTLHKFCQRLQKAYTVGNEWNLLCQAYYLWLCPIEPLYLSLVPHRIPWGWGKSISTLLTHQSLVLRFKPKSVASEVPCTHPFHYFRGLLLLPSVFNR